MRGDRVTGSGRDLLFLSGCFFDFEVPKDCRYLLHYFATDIRLAFLRYYMVFRETRNFTDHTGVACSRRFVKRMRREYERLTTAYGSAKASLSEDGLHTLQLLERGKLALTKIPKT